MWDFLSGKSDTKNKNAGSVDAGAIAQKGMPGIRVLKKGPAMRVIFFYPGEEGTYIDNAYVSLFENGIVHIKSPQEETTTHLQNCEILWNFEVEGEERGSKIRLLKPKGESRGVSEPAPEAGAGMAPGPDAEPPVPPPGS